MSLTSIEIIICKKGNLEDILSLMNDGCDKNKILCQVCHYGHVEVVKYLVEKCEVNAREYNDCAVKWACEAGHLEVVKYLVEKCGANARAENNWSGRYASARGHLEVVKYLVEKCGADVRIYNDYAVQWACRAGRLEVVKYLIEKCGANARAKDDYAVHWASEYNYFEVIKYLIEKCGCILSRPNTTYQRYLSVYEKGEARRRCIMAKKIYFWWVQACYNPNSICGHRSMYKGYREYLNIR